MKPLLVAPALVLLLLRLSNPSPVSGQGGTLDVAEAELVLIDVKGDGIRLTSLDDGIVWTAARGTPGRRTSWTVAGSDDSFLAMDRNRDGKLEGVREIVGGIVLLRGWPAGFDSLKVFDGWKTEADKSSETRGQVTPDGIMDTNDVIFKELIVWTDSDHNGRSAEAELQSLPYAGFEALDLAGAVRRESTDAHGNVFTSHTTARRRAGQPGARTVEVVNVRLATVALSSR